jgi:hypothetical protein
MRFASQGPRGSGSTDPRSDSKVADKDDLHPVSKESTRSGTDDELAHNNASFNPSMTNPQDQKAAVGSEVGACSTDSVTAARRWPVRPSSVSAPPSRGWLGSSVRNGGVAGWRQGLGVVPVTGAAMTEREMAQQEIEEEQTIFLSGFWL